MYSLFILSLLFLLVQTDPRSPKIYNVLISTKKNLSPSHALPVYEPVLRAAPLGLPLPFYYHQPFTYQAIPPFNIANGQKQSEVQPSTNAEDKLSQEPLPFAQFIPYGFSPQQNIYQKQIDQLEKRTDDPKQEIANLKKNPNIPDVPPPAIPVKTS